MEYDCDLHFWKCPDCGLETWELDEAHCPRHEERRDRQRYEQALLLHKGHLWSGREKEPLPPVCVWIHKSQGHRKGRRYKNRKKSLEQLLDEMLRRW